MSNSIDPDEMAHCAYFSCNFLCTEWRNQINQSFIVKIESNCQISNQKYISFLGKYLFQIVKMKGRNKKNSMPVLIEKKSISQGHDETYKKQKHIDKIRPVFKGKYSTERGLNMYFFY